MILHKTIKTNILKLSEKKAKNIQKLQNPLQNPNSIIFDGALLEAQLSSAQ
jgi:hypothetical protein